MTDARGTRWVQDWIRGDVVERWRVDEVLYEGATPFQQVLIGRTARGITLFCDDNPQSTEFDQIAFHEAEIVPAMLLAEQVRDVLVIGSSEGVVSQIAAEAGARRVDHVDIDQRCVELCADYLPFGFTREDVTRAERGDGAVRLHYDDGLAFVDRAGAAGECYDVVVLDLPEEQEDQFSQQNRLYAADFLRQCKALLTDGGVVATHICRPSLFLPMAGIEHALERPLRRFREVFATAVPFRSDEHPWSTVLLGSNAHHPEPVSVMRNRLSGLPYPPSSIDDLALRRCAASPRQQSAGPAQRVRRAG